MKRVLKKYHLIIEVFKKSNVDKIAEHQAKQDHEIHPEKDKKASFVQNYELLLDQETAAMKNYIDEHLEKHFIRPSSSAAAFSIPLVRKPGTSLCFCINYRALNAVIIKNQYSIPLIMETLKKLAGVVQYTKLDVIYTFNRIRIKEDYVWLTAFNS